MGDPLYQKAVVQLVGESPIRVNAREPGSYSRMFLGNRRCLRRILGHLNGGAKQHKIPTCRSILYIFNIPIRELDHKIIDNGLLTSGF
ncbi:hypothetical protein [Leptospira noguchii]|uniref:hypothetical protein n=1 Tax=Leptospira noguchii TaxID=28182 RepID=UPI0015EFD957|nr:hypothetical protein [Leptospira noguchii]UOG51083.1 hypothetical protein MAL09_10055 [Leptospira noguchii]